MSFDKLEKLTDQDRSDLTRFVDLSRRKKVLKTELAEIEGELSALGRQNGRLTGRFIDLAIQSIKDVNGGATVYLRRNVYTKIADHLKHLPQADFFALLKDAGYDDLIKKTFDGPALAKDIKEVIKEDATIAVADALPAELRSLVEASEDFILVCKG